MGQLVVLGMLGGGVVVIGRKGILRAVTTPAPPFRPAPSAQTSPVISENYSSCEGEIYPILITPGLVSKVE